MCNIHGRLIDRDEQRFTIPVLHSWKKLAEHRAQLEQELARAVDLNPSNTREFNLVDHTVHVRRFTGSRIAIGDAFSDACVPQIWGRTVAEAVRDSVIELARNSLNHGRAQNVEISFCPGRIDLIDDGAPFDPLTLRRQTRVGGGSETLSHLLGEFSESLFVSYERKTEKNLISFSFVRTAEDIYAITPCFHDVDQGPVALSSFADCNRVFLILPRYMVQSDSLAIHMEINELETAGKEVVLVVTDVSAFVQEKIGARHPQLRILFASLNS